MANKPSTAAYSSRWLLTLLVAIANNAGCSNPPPKNTVLPHDSFTLQSAAVREMRRLNVYTPPGYAEGEQRYPVLYMPDGGVEEDFPHISNTINALVNSGTIAPVIVVGIENTQRRRDVTGPTNVAADREIAAVVGGSAAFRRFIGSELIPEIDRRYRTTDEKAIVGESLAGLFVIETFLLEPTLFDRYIAMDPSLWWNDHALANDAGARLPAMQGMNRVLWFTGSGSSDMVRPLEQLASTLKTDAPADLRWTYDPRPDEEHSTIFRATTKTAFEWALWKNP